MANWIKWQKRIKSVNYYLISLKLSHAYFAESSSNIFIIRDFPFVAEACVRVGDLNFRSNGSKELVFASPSDSSLSANETDELLERATPALWSRALASCSVFYSLSAHAKLLPGHNFHSNLWQIKATHCFINELEGVLNCLPATRRSTFYFFLLTILYSYFSPVSIQKVYYVFCTIQSNIQTKSAPKFVCENP